MKTLIFLLTIIAFSKASPNTQETTDKILDIFEQRNNVKELFKVWHMIYEKDYNYNTQEGIQKYVTFKQNLKVIQEHNSKDTFYKQGLNHLSDMTYEEIVNYYNLKPISHKEMKGFLQNMISLDDYNEEDDDESIKIQSKSGIVGRAKKDVRAYMRPVRDQLGCGSCWAFSTMAAIEGVYSKKYTKLTDWLSTQQLVDCDKSDNGCNGGWFYGAINYFKTISAIYEANYKYTGKQGICTEASKTHTSIKTTGFTTASNADTLYRLLANGPVAVAIDANSTFANYKSGVYNSTCISAVNHGVVLVGYGTQNGVGYWIIRNSWSDKWGNLGHIWVQENSANNGSCNIERYGYQPLIA